MSCGIIKHPARSRLRLPLLLLHADAPAARCCNEAKRDATCKVSAAAAALRCARAAKTLHAAALRANECPCTAHRADAEIAKPRCCEPGARAQAKCRRQPLASGTSAYLLRAPDPLRAPLQAPATRAAPRAAFLRGAARPWRRRRLTMRSKAFWCAYSPLYPRRRLALTPCLHAQTREAALAEAVAALEAAYTAAPADPRCSRLSAACRDQLSTLRGCVDAFELAALDEAGDAAAEELRKRRTAFDRRVSRCVASPAATYRVRVAHALMRRRLRVRVRDSALAAHKAARDAATAEVRFALATPLARRLAALTAAPLAPRAAQRVAGRRRRRRRARRVRARAERCRAALRSMRFAAPLTPLPRAGTMRAWPRRRRTPPPACGARAR